MITKQERQLGRKMPSENWEIETKNFIIFNNGILSNDYIIPFCSNLTSTGKLFNFNSVTHYINASKALLFKDEEIKEQILYEERQQQQINLGKQVKNYKEDIWHKHLRQIIYNGCFDKFYQNDKIFSSLISTEEKIIVASLPSDKVLGVGLDCNDIKIKYRNNWHGKNWLGQVLMKIREDLRNGTEYTFEDINWDEYENEY